MREFVTLLLILSLVLSVVACSTDNSKKEVTLHVAKPHDQAGQIIDNATVKVYDGDNKLIAEQAGSYKVKKGLYIIKAAAEGYQNFEQECTVEASQNVSVTPILDLIITIIDLKLETSKATVEVGSDFSLPQLAVATMSDGSTKEVAVQWSQTVNTSQEGEYTFTGTIAGTAKTVHFTLMVVESTGDITIDIDLEKPPAIPTNLTGEYQAGQIVLNWKQVEQDLSNDRFGGYLIYRSQSSKSLGQTIHSTLITGPTYIDKNVIADKIYYYRVRAYGGKTGMLAGGLSTAVKVSTKE